MSATGDKKRKSLCKEKLESCSLSCEWTTILGDAMVGSSPKPGMNDEEKQNDNPESQPAPRVIRDVSIQTALAIGLVLITAVATFFATRADLVGRLDRIDRRLMQVGIQHYIERTNLYTQITNLRIVEAELDRLEGFTNRWKPATLKFGRKLPYPTPRPPDQDVVVEARGFEGGPPKGYDQSLLGNVVTSDETRGIPDTEIMPRLHQVVLRLGKFNNHLAVMRIGALKEDAEDGIEQRAEDIKYIQTQLPGLKQKVIDCRHEIEAVLKPEGRE